MGYSLHNPRARDPVIVATVFAVIASVTVVFRLWSRKLRRLDFGIDDYLIICALVRNLEPPFVLGNWTGRLRFVSSLYILPFHLTTRV